MGHKVDPYGQPPNFTDSAPRVCLSGVIDSVQYFFPMEGIDNSYGDSATSDVHLGVLTAKKEGGGVAVLRSYEIGRSSLGAHNESGDGVTMINQLGGDEEDIFWPSSSAATSFEFALVVHVLGS